MKLSVEVTGIQEQQLSEAARRLNVPEEELALAAVKDLLARREADFDRAAALAFSLIQNHPFQDPPGVGSTDIPRMMKKVL